jgi:hypothetical protein
VLAELRVGTREAAQEIGRVGGEGRVAELGRRRHRYPTIGGGPEELAPAGRPEVSVYAPTRQKRLKFFPSPADDLGTTPPRTGGVAR